MCSPGPDGRAVGPSPDDNPPWLNQITVVHAIVRDFGSDVLRRFAEDEQDVFMAWLEREARRWNDLFLGYQPGEKRDDYKCGPWNTPINLGTSIPINMGFDVEDARLSVRDAFFVAASQIIDATTQHAGEDVSEWGWKLDAAVEDLSKALLGIPIRDENDLFGSVVPPATQAT